MSAKIVGGMSVLPNGQMGVCESGRRAKLAGPSSQVTHGGKP